jgi:hypothetical protein
MVQSPLKPIRGTCAVRYPHFPQNEDPVKLRKTPVINRFIRYYVAIFFD